MAALSLLALLTATHYDVFFLGRSLVTSNYRNPLDPRPSQANYGPDFVPHEEWTRRNLVTYPNIRDPDATSLQWEPSTRFLKFALASGEWPFWDPYIAGGTPAMANLVPAFFFPPYLVVVLLGASIRLLNAYFLFILWGGAYFTFLFLRRHHMTFVAAMGGSLAMLFSGTMQQHVGTFIGQTAACLPLVLHATRVFLDNPNRRRAALLAATYAGTALASFPPVLVGIFGLAGLYMLVAVVSEAGLQRRSVVLWWTIGVALAGGLVAFYYLPALVLRAASPQVSDLYKYAGSETMPVLNMYQLLSPTLMGGLQLYKNFVVPANVSAYLPYVGMSAIALAALAGTRAKCKSRTLLIACTLAMVLILLKLFGAPGVQWIGGLPVLSEIHIAHYFGIHVTFLVACLAALGLDSLWNGTPRPGRAFLVALLVIGMTESLWQIAESRRFFSSPFEAYWTQDWRVLATSTVVAATAIVVAALARHSRPIRAACAAVLIAAGMAEGIYNNWVPRPAAWSVFDHPPEYVRVVQHGGSPSRIFPAGALSANLNSALRIPSLASLMAFNPPRVYNLFVRYGSASLGVFMREPAKLPPDSVLDRANVGLIVTNRFATGIVTEAQARGYPSPYDDGLFVVFSRPSLPRYMFSSEYRVVPAKDALEAIAAPNPREIVLESHPGFRSASNRTADPAVTVESFRLNSVVLGVDAPRPGLLYASESYFDGWTAAVNGVPTSILPANYAFRAVVVPEGRSRVEFRYWPPGLTSGCLATLASAAGVCALLLLPSSRRRDAA
jgi:hypothetical protein